MKLTGVSMSRMARECSTVLSYILRAVEGFLLCFLRILRGFIVDGVKSMVLFLLHAAIFFTLSLTLVERFPHTFAVNLPDVQVSANMSVLPPDMRVLPNMSVLPGQPPLPSKSQQPEPSLSVLGIFLLIVLWGATGYLILPIRKRLLQWRL